MVSRSRTVIFYSIGALLTCAIILSFYIRNNHFSMFVVTTNDSETVSKPLKRILLWNKYRNRADHAFGIGHAAFFENKCEVTDCEITIKRNMLMDSDVVVLRWTDTLFKDLPVERSPGQLWVLFNRESPARFIYNDHLLDNKINWTMSYRLDANVTTLYGEFRPIENTDQKVSLPNITALQKHDNVSKIALVAWLVSHCNSPGKRDAYVNQLKKHIPVDIYGSCGSVKCPPSKDKYVCSTIIYNKYKFYLSFENSLCTDYVTEKFFYALKFGTAVPVVYGAADYCRRAPPHSYIDINDFASPRHLADYLKMLDQNDKLYQQYHAWRSHYTVVDFHPLCYLCAKLHSTSPDDIHTYESYSRWYFRDGDCLKPSWSSKKANNTYNVFEDLGGVPKLWRSNKKTLSIYNQNCD